MKQKNWTRQMVGFYKHNYVCFVLETVFIQYLVVQSGNQDGCHLTKYNMDFSTTFQHSWIETPKYYLMLYNQANWFILGLTVWSKGLLPSKVYYQNSCLFFFFFNWKKKSFITKKSPSSSHIHKNQQLFQFLVDHLLNNLTTRLCK